MNAPAAVSVGTPMLARQRECSNSGYSDSGVIALPQAEAPDVQHSPEEVLVDDGSWVKESSTAAPHRGKASEVQALDLSKAATAASDEDGGDRGSGVGMALLVAGQAWAKLSQYCQALVRDSFTVGGLMASNMEVECDDAQKFRVTLMLPAMCCLRRSFTSEWRTSKLVCMEEVAAAALHELTTAGQMCPLEVEHGKEAQGSSLSWPLEGGRAPELFSADSVELDVPEVSVFTISVDGENSGPTYGILCGKTPRYNYTWCVDGFSVVRLECKTIPWSHEYDHLTEVYHWAVTGEDCGVVGRIVRLGSHGSLDIEGMPLAKGKNDDHPWWLQALGQRIRRLLLLDRLSFDFVPVFPMPNPVSLERALSFDSASCETLKMLGCSVLHVLALFASYLRHPNDDARRLRMRADALVKCRSRLAKLAEMHVFFEFSRDVGHSIAEGAAASAVEALFGACVCEKGWTWASLASVWWWLLKDPKIVEPPVEDELGLSPHSLDRQMPHTGRTPTYTTLMEVILDDGSTALKVVYGESGLTLLYRMHDGRPQEKPFEASDLQWKFLRYDFVLETFVSSVLRNDFDGKYWPLPNKICFYLCLRRPLASLIRLKHQDTSYLVYTKLIELRDGTLQVHYDIGGRELIRRYRRCWKGGLGTEIDGDSELHLIFSEEKKALLSPSLGSWTLHPIPLKVCDWLQCKFLSLCVLGCTLKKRGRKSLNDEKQDAGGVFGADMECDVVVSDEQVQWRTSQGSEYTLRFELTDVGIVYVTTVRRDDSEVEGCSAELEYDEKTKQCRTADAQSLPHAAEQWLRSHNGRLTGMPFCRALLHRWSAKHAAAPWLNTPSFVKLLFPKIGLTDIGRLESTLCHTFRNPMLLAQALTHPSKVGALTPCYQRLAAVGEAVVEFCVTQWLVVPVLSRNHGGNAASAISMGGFVAERVLPRGSRAHLRRSGGSGGGGDSEEGGRGDGGCDPEEGRWCELPLEARRRKEAYCNHVLFARTSVLLGLHLSLQHDAADLARSVQGFADSVRRGGSSRQTLRTLVSRGAPRALGDCFLACVGAVALDWEGMDHACKVVKKHLKLSAGAPAALQTPCGVILKERKSCSASEFARTMSRLQECIRISSLAPPPPPLPAASSPALTSCGASTQFSVLDALCDMHVVEDGNGRVLGGTSPRSAWFRAAVLLHPDPGIDFSSDQFQPLAGMPSHEYGTEDSSGKEEQDDNGKADLLQPLPQHETSHGSECYCFVCDLYLNGPTQFGDHKIGKKHRKNVQRGQPVAKTVKQPVDRVKKNGQAVEASGPWDGKK